MAYNSTVSTTTSIDMSKEEYGNYNVYLLNGIKEDIIITLPSNLWDGLTYDFIRIDNNESVNVTINPFDSETTINNTTTLTIPINSKVQTIFSNNNWVAPLVRVTY